jgi:acetyl esterase/lipase
VFLTAACCLPLGGCSPLRLLNIRTPESGYRQIKDVEYGSGHRQKLDIYIPVEKADTAPVVIFFYGGGWREGKKSLYKYIGEAISSLGFVAVILDYRLYPEVKFPVFVEDGATAVAWVQHNIGRYQGDCAG